MDAPQMTKPITFTLYPEHIEAIEEEAKRLGIAQRPRHLSRTLQHIISEYRRQQDTPADDTPTDKAA